jgi:RHS repeat-associated protein
VNDADGNTLSGGGRTNTWDAQNRLIGCAYNGHTTSTVYGYDGLRRQSTIDGVTTDYLLDGDNAVQEGHAVNGTFTSTATYFNGMYRRDDVAGTVRWYLMDGLGSVVGEVDPSGNLTCSRGFDVYGATRSQTGTPTSKHGFVGKLGHETEDTSGLTYMRARWYDPAVGRFISEDPGRHGGNWLAYASNSPTNRTDPDGKVDVPKPWVNPLANPAAGACIWWFGAVISILTICHNFHQAPGENRYFGDCLSLFSGIGMLFGALAMVGSTIAAPLVILAGLIALGVILFSGFMLADDRMEMPAQYH